jgi:uncharacterized protein HemY
MVGTLLYLLLAVLLLTFLLAIVLLPVMAIGFYFWKWRLPRSRRGALMQPSQPLLCRLENSNS